MEEIVLGGGCFWCTEAAFQELEGVESVTSGYAGGEAEDPTYREVCTGETGHAEVVEVRFDGDEIGFEEILEFFFRIHDPTTEDREGPDVGSQYRSIILYETEEQRKVVDKFIGEKRNSYSGEIVTEVERLEKFYQAEEKHQNYFEKNPEDAYCVMHAQPKKEKARNFSRV